MAFAGADGTAGKGSPTVARFRQAFQSHVQSGLSDWPNYNIDSGQIEPPSDGESAA
ncbi:MAG: hypothetical protein ACRENP_13215 [Longimicrobiales bacterium]